MLGIFISNLNQNLNYFLYVSNFILLIIYLYAKHLFNIPFLNMIMLPYNKVHYSEMLINRRYKIFSTKWEKTCTFKLIWGNLIIWNLRNYERKRSCLHINKILSISIILFIINLLIRICQNILYNEYVSNIYIW